MFKDMDDLVIQEIARHAHISETEVRAEYTRQLHELASHARVRDFLPLLAMKQVRQVYLRRAIAVRATPVAPALPAIAAPMLR